MAEEGVHIRIFQGWNNKDYPMIDEWVTDCEGAVWDYNGGKSYINGKVFYSMIFFDCEEDLVAFKLKFGL